MRLNWNIVQMLWQAILVLVLGLCTRYCASHEKETVYKETIITKVYDSTRKSPPAAAPPKETSTRTIEVPARVDTAAILRAHFTERTYEQTYRDSSLRALISNTVVNNRLADQKFSYQLLQPVRTIESTTVATVKPAKGIYAGIFTTFSKADQRFGIGPRITILTRKEALIGGGVDLLNRSAIIDAQFKLRWKK